LLQERVRAEERGESRTEMGIKKIRLRAKE
jgi:hypothetical protein